VRAIKWAAPGADGPTMAISRTKATRLARVCAGALAVAGIIAAALNAILGVGGAFSADIALPVFGELILFCAVTAIIRRAVTVKRDRSAWAAIACGALAWTSGDVYRQIAFPAGAHRYFPSLADAGYLLLYPCAYVGLWLLVRARLGRFRRSLWLDGLIGAAGVAALGVSVVIHFVLVHTGGRPSTVATNLAYPLADVVLLAQLFAAMAMAGWRPGRSWLLIGSGLGIFATADAAYAYTAATGDTYVVAIGPLWIIAFVLIAIGAWQDDEPRGSTRHRQREGKGIMVAPTLFALIATALLAFGQRHHLPAAGYGFAVFTLLLVMFRTALTFRENIALLDSRRASLTDELTGLPNRRRLYQRLGELVAGGSIDTFAGLLLVDLDGFKELNDTLGHHAGDTLLAGLGPRLSGLGGLDLVARLGGDEFAAIVRGEASAEVLSAAARRLHSALEQPFEFDDLTVHVGASIGGALHPDHGDSVTELMRHADVGMYSAKSARSGYELYRPERDLNSRDRLRLVGELQRALHEGELVLRYQPLSDTTSGRITAVEALVRWAHPTEGLLTPDRFLDVAESAGLMRQLTSYVLERALRQLAEWDHDGTELAVAVNLAMPNLLDLRLPDEVARLLALTSVGAERLTLEITENIVMADPDRILEVVGRLRDLGVRLSLDDFGAGASSLGYIKRLAVDELKIDRSFVTTMAEDEDNAAIVGATIELAHSLGLSVVAEGVETPASLERLRALGCDQVQGYLLSRPVSATDLTLQVARDVTLPAIAVAAR
jgi:diguanylate cyclase